MEIKVDSKEWAEWGRLNKVWFKSKDRYEALLSQGKYCPPEILAEAKKAMRTSRKTMEDYRDEIFPPETAMQWFLYKLAPNLVTITIVLIFVIWVLM